MHDLLAFAQRLQEPSGWAGSGSHRTFKPLQESQARGRFASLGDLALSWPPS